MKNFFWKDKTGRDFVNEFDLSEILTWDNEDEYDVEELHSWAENADVGEEWNDRTFSLICIKNE